MDAQKMNNENKFYPVSSIEWLILYLIFLIPVYGQIKFIKMASDRQINPVLSNFARAFLYVLLLFIVAVSLFWLLLSKLIFPNL